MNPSQRTYRLLESWGWHHWWIVERFNGFAGTRTDLFNIIDIIVLTKDGVVGVQSFGEAFSEHKKKLMEEQAHQTRKWLKCPGNRLILIGWRKLRMKGTKKRLKSYPRVAHITLEKDQLVFVEEELKK